MANNKVLAYDERIGEFLRRGIDDPVIPGAMEEADAIHHDQTMLPISIAVEKGVKGYDGPFAAKFDFNNENEPRIVVNSGVVICGQYALTTPVCYFPLANGYNIIGKITYNGSYHVDVLQRTGYGQGYDYVVFRIAYIYEGRIIQTQYGDFFVAGRVV